MSAVEQPCHVTRELKPFEIPFLSTDDSRFLSLRYQILKYFKNWLTTIEVKETEKHRMLV